MCLRALLLNAEIKQSQQPRYKVSETQDLE